jgi:Gly-Xaa carboxypeptidase
MASWGGQDSVRLVSFILGVEVNLNDTHRTESYDHMQPVGVDPRWDVFGPFHDYLLQAFPLVYVFLSIRAQFLTGLQLFYLVVDQSQYMGFGLRVAWIRRKPQTGPVRRTPRYRLRDSLIELGDSTPIDVVPVNPDTVDEWKYPPYSGHYDGTLPFECGDVIPTI